MNYELLIEKVKYSLLHRISECKDVLSSRLYQGFQAMHN